MYIYEVHLHCSDVIVIYMKYICLIISRDMQLLKLKCIDLREKGESFINLLLFIVYIIIMKRSTLYILYIKMSSDKA